MAHFLILVTPLLTTIWLPSLCFDLIYFVILSIPSRFEREEAFIALNLTVKNATLQDSLEQFVKGELLEGANAYFCEKCGEKVS